MRNQQPLSEAVQEVAAQIGQFFLQKNNGDYTLTEKEIRKMGISKIETNGDEICITTTRPGLLIGVRGNTITALERFLQQNININKIHIIEEKYPLESYLIPYDDRDDDYEWKDVQQDEIDHVIIE